jgi:chitin deacetylase
MDLIGPDPLPAWVETYNAVKAQGLIPGFPNATAVDGWPVYGRGVNPADPDICSFSVGKCTMEEDVVNAPDGTIGISFDDGPQLPSPELYDFLSREGIPSTHFLIGSRVLENPSLFSEVLAMGGHLAVHTWSHPLMSTLTDLQVLGELGWTMQIIYDEANGLVPAYWRPPYGDVDMRVRAIAKNVFGLTTILWNQDSKDWCLPDDGSEVAACAQVGPQSDSQLARELRSESDRVASRRR